MNSHSITVSLLGAWLSAASLVSAFADSATPELYSPKDADHFEVTKPLLYWTSVEGAKSYEVYVDNAKVAEVPAQATFPVMHDGLTTPLVVGAHQWFVKAIPATGDPVTSGTSSFTVDPAGNWPDWAIGPFERYGKNPLLRPQGTTWESVNAFNPGVNLQQGKFRMLYRAQGGKGNGGTSREGYAEGVDGVTFTRNPQPLLDQTEDFEKHYGLEDARLFHYDKTYYAFYTGNNPGSGVAICEATSPDGTNWTKLGVVIGHTKNAAMICDPNGTPVKINGKFAMYCGNSNFGISYSDDLLKWSPMQKIDAKLPPGWVSPFEPCVAVTDFSKTQPDNVVLFIAGTLNGKHRWFYAISEMLFSKSNLTTKVAQLDDCIMKPQETYESGQNKNCLWMNCIISQDNQWMMYYGAGDRNVALATAPMK
jgi:predicted GH43/DUF377 family glycosyl hydrolase